MKACNFTLVRYDADEGKVFDWKEPRYVEVFIDGKSEEIQEHLNAKTLFIGGTDSIENYIEVDEAGNAIELITPEFATDADYQEALAELGVE
jgi:hypothetical protein